MSLLREEFDRVYKEGFSAYLSKECGLRKINPYDFEISRDKYDAWSSGFIAADLQHAAKYEYYEETEK